MKLKYNNSEQLYEIKAYQVSGNIVKIQGDSLPENDNGFIIIHSDNEIEDFSSYTTKYNVLTDIANGIMYSDNGTVETDNNLIVIPSLSEIAILTEAKKDRVEESKKMLESFFTNHPLVSSCHSGAPAYYTVTLEKQQQMANQYMTYQMEKEINPEAVLTWNESGEECEPWTEEEFIQLVLEAKAYVYPAVSYQQTIEKTIKNCKTLDELENVVIDYEQFALGV